MPTTAQHIAARSDNDLLARFIAKAEMMPDVPAEWIQQNIVKLIQVPVAEGKTITDVHAFAAGSREAYIAATPPSPGVNPAAVLDSYLEAAILAVKNPVPPEEPAV